MEKVISSIEEKKKWLDEMRHKQETRPKTDTPIVFVHEIQSQQRVIFVFFVFSTNFQSFESVVTPILSKKPPPPKAPEPPKETPAEDGQKEQPAEMEVD